VLHVAQQAGHAAIATLIRNTKQKGAKDVLPQACTEKIKKQQEDADRAMRELLEEDEKEKVAAAAGSQKKSKKKKAGGQGTASACKTAPDVRGGMQIWVKTLTGKTITLELVLQVERGNGSRRGSGKCGRRSQIMACTAAGRCAASCCTSHHVCCSSHCRGGGTVHVQVWQLVGWTRGSRDRHRGRGW
jgi:hypothetical protein